MQIKPVKNPWESSFENLTTKVQKTVKKAAGDATKTIAADVKQQVVGEQAAQAIQANQALQAKQEEVKPEEQKRLKEWRRNLVDLEAQIKKAREERIKKQAEQVKQVKKVEEKKKQDEPIWKKMMKMGSQAERKVNAGG